MTALTDLRDIGRYVAKVIVDDRTLNQLVFVYNEMWSKHQIYDLLEKLSGEQIPRHYDSLEVLQQRISDAEAKLKDKADDFMVFVQKVGSQLVISKGRRVYCDPRHHVQV